MKKIHDGITPEGPIKKELNKNQASALYVKGVETSVKCVP